MSSCNISVIQPYQRKFPYKLWKLMGNFPIHSEVGPPRPRPSPPITWTKDGEFIVIHPKKFQDNLLDNAVFKTGNLLSFIRQLNLYGFKKHGYHRVPLEIRNRTSSLTLLAYSHPNFKRDRPDLLKNVTRKAASASRREAKAAKSLTLPRLIKARNIKTHSVSPALQSARNKFTEVLQNELHYQLSSYARYVEPAPVHLYANSQDLADIGAEEVVDDSQEFDYNSIVGSDSTPTDNCRDANQMSDTDEESRNEALDAEKSRSTKGGESSDETEESFSWHDIDSSQESVLSEECVPFSRYLDWTPEVPAPGEMTCLDELSLMSYEAPVLGCGGNACAVSPSIPSCRTVVERRSSEGWEEDYMYPEDFPWLKTPPSRHIDVANYVYPHTRFMFEGPIPDPDLVQDSDEHTPN